MKTQIIYQELIDSCILNITYYSNTLSIQKHGILGEFFTEICNKKLNKYNKILIYLMKRSIIHNLNKSELKFQHYEKN